MDCLRSSWAAMYKEKLPLLARSHYPSQSLWPVQLDHCFARIILDAVVGRGELFDPLSSAMTSTSEDMHTPWTAKLKGPAISHMSEDELRNCISLGEAIAEGTVNLVELDEKSLRVRGKTSKTGGSKRKREKVDIESVSMPPETKKRPEGQIDIRTALGAPPRLPSSPALPMKVEPDLRELIQSSKLTPFRKRVLLALCQVPKGQVVRCLLSLYRLIGNAL